MPTLLNRPALPFWAYIVIITVGSVLVLVSVLAVSICLIRRAKARRYSIDSGAGVDKRLTLRRGRLVQSADYHSLTGSFGAGHFLTAEDLEKGSTRKTRSRSPFEWLRIVNEKSSLRHSLVSVSQVSSVTEVYETPTKAFYERKELAVSTHNLAITTEKDHAVTTQELSRPTTPSPVEKPSKNTNFSRSFSKRGENPTHNKTLSRIEEASPHTSMNVGATLKKRASSASAFNMNNNRSSQMFEIRRQNASPHPPSDLSRSNSESQSSCDSEPTPALPAIPPAIMHRASRTSLHEESSRRSHSRSRSQSSRRTSMASRRESIKTTSSRRASKVPLPESPESLNEYWDAKSDQRPVSRRTSSRKVLRKKSLRESQMWAPRTNSWIQTAD